MTNPQVLPVWTAEQRARAHQAFNRWMQACTEQEYEKLMDLREQVAPGEVCSIVKLVQSCYARPELLAGLPASLVQLMRERNLPQPFAVASAAAG